MTNKPHMTPPNGDVLYEKPDKFHQHEVLHTAHVLMDAWQNHIIDTVFLGAHRDIAQKAEEAINAMMQVYQSIGAVETEPKENDT